MKKVLIILITVLLIALNANCISTAVPGGFMNLTTQHVYTNNPGGQLSSAKVVKSGESCSMTFFPIFPFFYGGGGSIEEAKKEAGITKVAVVDRKSVSVLGPLFTKECVVVWGE
ncbi:MAG: hypothetical protein IT569_10140 [Leptospiraceae bacterium]|nr:hypothetical protein [Leptospiraceae bacterium]